MIELNDRVAWRTPLLRDIHGTVIAVREKLGRPRCLNAVTVRWDYSPGVTPSTKPVDEDELVLVKKHSELSEAS